MPMSLKSLEPAITPEVPAEPLLRLLIGFEASQVLMTAHQLGVFQILSEGSLGFSELCQRLGLPSSSGERLLQACVALNLLEFRGDSLCNSLAVETYLLSGKERYLGGLVDYYQDIYMACSRLPQAIVQNQPQLSRDGEAMTDIFSAMEGKRELTSRFSEAMHSLGLLEGRRLAILFPFEKITCLLDVGGGSGALAIALAKSFPHLQVRIFDRPGVCELAQRHVETEQLASRIHAIPGDFWNDVIPQAGDAILLSMILHDWDPRRGLQLLKNCWNALPAGGCLLIYEQLLNEDRCGPAVTCLTNLTMLLRTRSGSEYTEEDYRRLLRESGFEAIQVHRTSGLRHLIQATKA